MDKKTLLLLIFWAIPFCFFIIIVIIALINSVIQSKRDKLSKNSPSYTSRSDIIPWCIFLIIWWYMWLHSMFSIDGESSNDVNNIEFSDTIENENHIFVNVKYWNRVDVAKFDTIDTSKSSFIRNAYYDKNNQYLILNLEWTYYHRCDVPNYIRTDFKNSESFWKYYNKYIKWEYDCRQSVVPSY